MHESEIPSYSIKMSILQRLHHQTKYGLLAQSILLRLAKIGIELTPYFIYVEDAQNDRYSFPDQQYWLQAITVDNAADVSERFPESKRIWLKTWNRRLSNGEIGLLLMHGNDVVGFTWAGKSACASPSGNTLFKLVDGEAYLHDMVIASSFRGANLAATLRKALADGLAKENILVGYSVSTYFNKPANRFKEKIGARKNELRCEIILFRKSRYDFRLRRYQHRPQS